MCEIFNLILKLATLYKNSKDEFGVHGDFNKFLLEQTHPESKICLQKFLSVLNNFCCDFETLRYYINSINKTLKNGNELEFAQSHSKRDEEYNSFIKCHSVISEFKQFIKIFSKFVGSKYLVFNDKQLNIVIPTLDLNKTLTEWNKLVNEIPNGHYDCIITADGKINLAVWEHELLCYWLSLNNISLDNALRVCQNPVSPKSLYLSSLAPYKYHENTQKDLNMHLTDAQAKSFFEMFMKLSKGKKVYEGQTFEDIFCEYSENLGAGTYDERVNLKFNALKQ